MGLITCLIYVFCPKTYHKVYSEEPTSTEYISIEEFEQIYKEQSRMVEVYL